MEGTHCLRPQCSNRMHISVKILLRLSATPAVTTVIGLLVRYAFLRGTTQSRSRRGWRKRVGNMCIGTTLSVNHDFRGFLAAKGFGTLISSFLPESVWGSVLCRKCFSKLSRQRHPPTTARIDATRAVKAQGRHTKQLAKTCDKVPWMALGCCRVVIPRWVICAGLTTSTLKG